MSRNEWKTNGRDHDRFPKLADVSPFSCPGNHEVGSGEQWVHYEKRWPNPSKSSGSTSPLYWSVDVGPAHVVALNSYDNFVNGGDAIMRTWLEADLAAVDRRRTPWVLVMVHAPFYNSNGAHHGEAELMRQAYEPIFFDFGVDVVLSGHVHAYERSDARGVYDFDVDDCGPVYVNLGDGGNRENTYTRWEDPPPAWTAFRESSFGVGHLSILGATRAAYAWRRDACGDPGEALPGVDLNASSCATPGDEGGAAHETADELVLDRSARAGDACARRRATGAARLRPAPEATFGPDAAEPAEPAEPAERRDDHEKGEDEAREAFTVEVSLLAACLGTAASFLLGLLAGCWKKDDHFSLLKACDKHADVEHAALITPPGPLKAATGKRHLGGSADDADHSDAAMIALT